MNGTIKTKYLFVSPPSSRFLHDLAISKIRDILQAIAEKKIEPIKIVLAISRQKENMVAFHGLDKFPYSDSFDGKQKITKLINTAYVFVCNCRKGCKIETQYVDLSKSPWIEYYF